MLKFAVLACLIAVTLASTNHYIGTLVSTSAVNFPYPVNKCSKASLFSSVYKKYVCNSASSITETTYTDAACTVMSGNGTTYTTSTGQGLGSWSCGGDDNYASVDVYIGACTATKIATSYYAVDVCYQTLTGNYSLATCTDDEATIKSFASTDNSCSGTTIGTTLTASTECGAFTTAGTSTIYAALTSCEIMMDTTEMPDSAYIPSIMAIFVLLAFNIAYLL